MVSGDGEGGYRIDHRDGPRRPWRAHEQGFIHPVDDADKTGPQNGFSAQAIFEGWEKDLDSSDVYWEKKGFQDPHDVRLGLPQEGFSETHKDKTRMVRR